ncbi:MAG: hypothetical protein V4561_12885 [Bacteroidota bacterium]
MDTKKGSFEECYRNIKTVRQKKRLVKKDFDKQLISLHKKRIELQKIKKNLPLVKLENPYQKGWVRTFELRPDIAESKNADFYRALLSKINSRQYSNVKHFKTKRRKHRKKIWIDKPQMLQEFDMWQWSRNAEKFSEKEKLLFYPKEYWCSMSKTITVKYVFIEAWRFMLKVRPNIITHQRMIDEVLEQEISCIDKHIDAHFLEGRINKLVYGNSYQWRRKPDENPKHKINYLNELLNQ